MRPVKQSTEPTRSRTEMPMKGARGCFNMATMATSPRLAPTTDRHPGVSTSAGGGETPVSTDQAAPWLVGDDGRVHWRVD